MKQIILLLLICFSLSAIPPEPNTIRITNGEWEPFLSEKLYEYGFYSHIVSEAFKLEGITVEWGFFPWARSYNLARYGIKWSASALWWPSEKTEAGFYISDPVGETSFVFFHLKSFDFAWNSFNDLEGLSIGVTLEYDYGADFEKAVKEGIFTIYYSSTDELSFKNLLAGRIDLFPNDPVVGYAQIRNRLSAIEIDKITHNSKEFEKSSLSLIISRNDNNGEYYLMKFNSGLKKLKASVKYQQMLNDFESGKYD